jgi:hypothetical protein
MGVIRILGWEVDVRIAFIDSWDIKERKGKLEIPSHPSCA